MEQEEISLLALKFSQKLNNGFGRRFHSRFIRVGSENLIVASAIMMMSKDYKSVYEMKLRFLPEIVRNWNCAKHNYGRFIKLILFFIVNCIRRIHMNLGARDFLSGFLYYLDCIRIWIWAERWSRKMYIFFGRLALSEEVEGENNR